MPSTHTLLLQVRGREREGWTRERREGEGRKGEKGGGGRIQSEREEGDIEKG